MKHVSFRYMVRNSYFYKLKIHCCYDVRTLVISIYVVSKDSFEILIQNFLWEAKAIPKAF